MHVVVKVAEKFEAALKHFAAFCGQYAARRRRRQLWQRCIQPRDGQLFVGFLHYKRIRPRIWAFHGRINGEGLYADAAFGQAIASYATAGGRQPLNGKLIQGIAVCVGNKHFNIPLFDVLNYYSAGKFIFQFPRCRHVHKNVENQDDEC